MAWHVHQVMIDRFMASFEQPPKELILDFDATDDAAHGKQESYFFSWHADHYCFLPLYVFCEDQLLVSYLRPGNIAKPVRNDSKNILVASSSKNRSRPKHCV